MKNYFNAAAGLIWVQMSPTTEVMCEADAEAEKEERAKCLNVCTSSKSHIRWQVIVCFL
jgi:hypothetical protein